MKQTNKLKGRIFQLLDRGRAKRYVASFDITGHTRLLNGTSVHLAFAKLGDDELAVSLCTAGQVPQMTHHTRTCSEILSEMSDDKFGKEVFPYQFVHYLESIGLTKKEYQDLVEKARYELNSN